MWEIRVWFETMITTGPAPTLFGETVTRLAVITPFSCRGTGGRARSLKSLPPPHATSPSPNRLERSAATGVLPLPLILSRGTLTEPH